MIEFVSKIIKYLIKVLEFVDVLKATTVLMEFVLSVCQLKFMTLIFKNVSQNANQMKYTIVFQVSVPVQMDTIWLTEFVTLVMSTKFTILIQKDVNVLKDIILSMGNVTNVAQVWHTTLLLALVKRFAQVLKSSTLL